MSAKRPNANGPKYEVSALRRFANQRMGVESIAKALGRSTASVKQKTFWLDLSLAGEATFEAKLPMDRQSLDPR